MIDKDPPGPAVGGDPGQRQGIRRFFSRDDPLHHEFNDPIAS